MLLPPVCLPFEMLEGRSHALGDTCSGCPIRSRFNVFQNAELAGWEDTPLTEVVKLAERKPAEVAMPTASVHAAACFTACHSNQTARSSRVSSRTGMGHVLLCFQCLVQDLAHGVSINLIVEQIGLRRMGPRSCEHQLEMRL